MESINLWAGLRGTRSFGKSVVHEFSDEYVDSDYDLEDSVADTETMKPWLSDGSEQGHAALAHDWRTLNRTTSTTSAMTNKPTTKVTRRIPQVDFASVISRSTMGSEAVDICELESELSTNWGAWSDLDDFNDEEDVGHGTFDPVFSPRRVPPGQPLVPQADKSVYERLYADHLQRQRKFAEVNELLVLKLQVEEDEYRRQFLPSPRSASADEREERFLRLYEDWKERERYLQKKTRGH